MKILYQIFFSSIVSVVFQPSPVLCFTGGQQKFQSRASRYSISEEKVLGCQTGTTRISKTRSTTMNTCQLQRTYHARRSTSASATSLKFSLTDVILPAAKTSGGGISSAVLGTIAAFYRTYPFLSAFVTCAIKASVADIVAQKSFGPKVSTTGEEDEDSSSTTTVRTRKEELSNTQQREKNNSVQTVVDETKGGLAQKIETRFKNVAGDPTTGPPPSIGILKDGEFILRPSSSQSNIAEGATKSIKLPWDIDDDEVNNDDDNSSSDRQNRVKTNKHQTLAFFLYGGLYQGCVLEFVFNHLMPYWFGSDTGFVTVACKVLFDLSFFSPFVTLPIAYITKAVIFRYGLMEALERYWHDVRHNGLVKKHWLLWGPTNCLTFSIIPKHFRIAFVAFVSFFWMITLSYTSSKSDAAAASSSSPSTGGGGTSTTGARAKDDEDDIEVCFTSDGYTCDDRRRRRKFFRLDSVSLRQGEVGA